MSGNAVYDFIVVGARSAGAVDASRLSDKGAYRVLLLSSRWSIDRIGRPL